jgi:hypothetical protein
MAARNYFVDGLNRQGHSQIARWLGQVPLPAVRAWGVFSFVAELGVIVVVFFILK